MVWKKGSYRSTKRSKGSKRWSKYSNARGKTLGYPFTPSSKSASWLPYKRSWALSNPKWTPVLGNLNGLGQPAVLRTKLRWRATYDIAVTNGVYGFRNFWLTIPYDPATGTNYSAYAWKQLSELYFNYHVVGVKWKLKGTCTTNTTCWGKFVVLPVISTAGFMTDATEAISQPNAKFRDFIGGFGEPSSFQIQGYDSVQTISGRKYDPNLDNANTQTTGGPNENYVLSCLVYQENGSGGTPSIHVTVEFVYYVEFNNRKAAELSLIEAPAEDVTGGPEPPTP